MDKDARDIILVIFSVFIGVEFSYSLRQIYDEFHVAWWATVITGLIFVVLLVSFLTNGKKRHRRTRARKRR